MFSDQKGLSLIECMVAIGIVAICYFFVLSSIQTWLQSREAFSVLSSQQAIIRFAESQTRNRGLPVVICPLSTDYTCGHLWVKDELVFVDTEGNRKVENPSQVLKTVACNISNGLLYFQGFPKGMDSVRITSGSDFNSDNGTFWYCLPRATNPVWALVLSNTGRIRVVYPDKSGMIKSDDGKELICRS